jgi:peptidoglycan/xylan/chitin deacetylase (PgdA/CDA1 family)
MRLIRPFILTRFLFPGAIFRIRTSSKVLCLTFDDGPDPGSTPGILNILESGNVKATFFCKGENAERHPDLITLIRSKGHIIGNHGYHHLDGWKTSTRGYLRNFSVSAGLTSELLLRPPYGRIRCAQYRKLSRKYRIVFWDLMPFDFDCNLKGEQVLDILKKRIRPGSVIVLHDTVNSSVHSFLDEFIHYARAEGYGFVALPVSGKK